MSRLARVAAAGCLLLAACSSGGDNGTVEGIVVDVVGDLVTVDSFTVRLEGGGERIFEPAPGLLFDGSAPLSHLSDHLRSGEPVMVRYQRADDGGFVAVEVGDA